MAEYKNGFNAFGGIPVDSSRRSPELHTGRAVYINDDEYSDEPAYKNKADSIMNEGYHREAPFEAPEIIVPEPIIPSGTKNITENGTYDVTQFAKAEVNVAGGGSSDFSTANVTITKPEGKIVVWPCPTIISDKLVDRNYEQQELTETHPVALYKGVLEISALPGTFSIISGNVTEDEDSGTITITGDCSLQYTGF